MRLALARTDAIRPSDPAEIRYKPDIHVALDTAFNAKDPDGLAALYETDARMVTATGSVAEGVDAIREQWQGVLALDGQMTLRTRFVVGTDDIALLRNDSSFKSSHAELAFSTAEVVRRQQDGCAGRRRPAEPAADDQQVYG